ncbi:hypothetical protein [Sagittula sp. S175]|uniref:hypothetical protein n=1 Tax=Sagittula sp. S175 TaxID=3415129 RepID=UPI003C7BC031
MDIVYQQIWDADMAGNGLPALRPGEPKDPKRGYVVVNEPDGPVSRDFRVLAEVVIPEHKAQTYRLCNELLNNYALERRAREVLRPQELEEETRFIEAALDTPVMELARQVLETRGGVPVPRAFMAAKIRECWFEIGRSGGQEEASGFEHVFVGE